NSCWTRARRLSPSLAGARRRSTKRKRRIRAGFPLCYAGRRTCAVCKIKPGEENAHGDTTIRLGGLAPRAGRLFHRRRLAGSDRRGAGARRFEALDWVKTQSAEWVAQRMGTMIL